MIKELLQSVTGRLSGIDPIVSVAEDMGQLDSPVTAPFSFPCVLVDASGFDYSERSAGAQEAVAVLCLRIADSPLGMTDYEPFSVFDLMDRIYVTLQGMEGEDFNKLSRVRTERVPREDGIREYQMDFRFSFIDVQAVKPTTTVKPEVEIVPALER